MENAAPLIVLKELAGNPEPRLNFIQSLLMNHVQLLTDLWISLWIMTAIILLIMYFRAYRAHRTNTPKHH